MGSLRRLRLWLAFAPLLLLVAVGIRDFGGAFFDTRKLGDAAFEATKWGRAYGYDAAKITDAARSATKLTGIAVSPMRPCGCPTATAILQAECNAACPGGGWSHPYIVVTTAMCYSPTFNWPGVAYCSAGDSRCAAAHCSANQVLLSAQSLTLQ
jgi:hypothetical protein